MIKARIFISVGLSMMFVLMLMGSSRATYPNIITGNIDAWDMSTLVAGKAKDFGSGALDLTISGPIPTSGICEGAYAFNGISDKMTNSVNPLAGLSATYTIAMYVSKTLTGPFTAYALTFGSGAKAVVYGFTSGKYQLFNGGFSTGITVLDSNKHWVVWVSSDSGGLKEYLDGVLVNSGGAFTLGGSVGAFVVGGSGSADWFGGTFDEVYIYSTALSATDVANIAPVCSAPPTVSTVAASSILCDGAILNGNLTGKGTSNPVAVGFHYGLSPLLSGATNVTASSNASVGTFNFTATGLAASTFYYFRAWANGTDGYATGSILFFTTTSCPPPSSSCTPVTVPIIGLIALMLLWVFGFGLGIGGKIPVLSFLGGIGGLYLAFLVWTATCDVIVSTLLFAAAVLTLLVTVFGMLPNK